MDADNTTTANVSMTPAPVPAALAPLAPANDTAGTDTNGATPTVGTDRAAKPVTRAKVEQSLPKRFARLDANRDGAISKGEWPAERARAFSKFDTNSDGKITLDELRVRTLANFDRRDRNHDGILQPEERGKAAGAAKAAPDDADQE